MKGTFIPPVAQTPGQQIHAGQKRKAFADDESHPVPSESPPEKKQAPLVAPKITIPAAPPVTSNPPASTTTYAKRAQQPAVKPKPPIQQVESKIFLNPFFNSSSLN